MSEALTETEMRRALAELGLDTSSDTRSTREIALAYGVIAVEPCAEIETPQPPEVEV